MNHLGPASPSNPDPLDIVRANDRPFEGCFPSNHHRGKSSRALRSFRRWLSPFSPAPPADEKTRGSAWTLAIVQPCCGAGLTHLLGIFSGGTAHTRECDAVEKPLRRKGYRSRPGNGSPAQNTNTISNGIAPYTRNYISKSSARSKAKMCGERRRLHRQGPAFPPDWGTPSVAIRKASRFLRCRISFCWPLPTSKPDIAKDRTKRQRSGMQGFSHDRTRHHLRRFGHCREPEPPLRNGDESGEAPPASVVIRCRQSR